MFCVNWDFQALEPYGIGVATGEHCQNRVMFKQFLSSGAMQYCQIDACRLGGPNEIIPIILMAAKFNGKISIPHSSGSNNVQNRLPQRICYSDL